MLPGARAVAVDESQIPSRVAMEQPTPKVSIGLPVYNGGRFIREALESLGRQTYDAFELIVSDNASTDGTETICREFAERDSRVRYVRQARNVGAAANFEFVLRLARGTYFMWAACDDLWDREWIAALVSLLEANEGAIAYGQLRTIDEDGQPLAHDADGRRFEYACLHPACRQASYYLEYEGLGKANPVYALMPRELLAAHFSKEIFGRPFGDCVLLFRLLAHARLISHTAVSHFKRIPAAGGGAMATASVPQQLATGVRKLLGTVAWALKAALAYRGAARRSDWIVLTLAIPKCAIFVLHHAAGARSRARNGAPTR